MSDTPVTEQLAQVSLSSENPNPSQISSLQDLEPPRQATANANNNTTSPSDLPNKNLSEIQNIALHATPATVAPHRSHDPSNNLKRSDPFQFGSRFLEEGDDVFEWNAWDHVDPSKDELFVRYSQQQYAFQKEHRLDDFERRRFNREPEKWWDRFYSNNKENFFKNRKWLQQEFPVLTACIAAPVAEDGAGEEGRGDGETRQGNAEQETKAPARDGGEWSDQVSSGPMNTILEIGAGAGNTAYPVLKNNLNPKLMVHASDFSKKAVELIRNNPAYDPVHIRAEVWDMADTVHSMPEGVMPGSVDVVMLVFAFSALNPRQWAQAVKNVWTALRPGGEVCFRDYGRGDLAQVRFKKGRLLEDNFYIRGDGTRVYFFDIEELRKIWNGNLVDALPEFETSHEDEASNQAIRKDASDAPAFEVLALAADRRLLVNRQAKLKMYRCWMQGRFRKPLNSTA